MYQFINGTVEQFAELETRVCHSTITFSDQPMPPGSSPTHARVGFERTSHDTFMLLVDDDIHVSDDAPVTPSVREWLTNGQRSFESFEACAAWIRIELAACYADVDTSPEALTDFDAVSAGLRREQSGHRVDETALFEALSTQVRGQETALRTLALRTALHSAREHPRRPLTLFAVGPTGVGKTRSAEVLAEALHTQQTGYGYIRIDMSEYQEHHRVSQLLGSPPGYVGYGDGSVLLDALQSNPRTVVHLDEIEKAHPKILQALMNAMDAGRLSRPDTSAGNRTVDCRSAIFYFTSNLDSEGILSALADRSDAHESHIVDEVCRQRLRAAGIAPELVGRIHGFLVFHPLNRNALVEVATLAVRRVAEEYGLRLAYIEPRVLLHLLVEADQGFGVRPLEYLADTLFGRAFAEATDRYGTAPIELTGPPFRCRLRFSSPPEKPDTTDVPIPPELPLN